jgi:hypothetical protein
MQRTEVDEIGSASEPMKLPHRSARILGALVGVGAFIVAMHAYLFAPVRHSFSTSWIPYVLAWAVYRFAWARLSMLKRCRSGCGALMYYQTEVCPRCLAPAGSRPTVTPARRATDTHFRRAKSPHFELL